MEDPLCHPAVKARWTTLRGSTLSNGNLQKLVTDTSKYLQDNNAVIRNYSKWEVSADRNYDQAILDLQNFLNQRANWMDGKIGAF